MLTGGMNSRGVMAHLDLAFQFVWLVLVQPSQSEPPSPRRLTTPQCFPLARTDVFVLPSLCAERWTIYPVEAPPCCCLSDALARPGSNTSISSTSSPPWAHTSKDGRSTTSSSPEEVRQDALWQVVSQKQTRICPSWSLSRARTILTTPPSRHRPSTRRICSPAQRRQSFTGETGRIPSMDGKPSSQRVACWGAVRPSTS